MKAIITIAALCTLTILPTECVKSNGTRRYAVTYTEGSRQATDTVEAEYFERAMFGSDVTFHSVGSAPMTIEHVDTIREL
jgi:hypothetical protein